MTVVATISKLFSSAALAEVVMVSPAMSRMGAAMSREIIPRV